MITLGELLHGTDEDFVVNLYLAGLGRWPDEVGYVHHVNLVAGRPEARAGIVRGFLASEEAQQRPRGISLDEAGPVPPERALAAQLRLRTEAMWAAINALRQRPEPSQSPLVASEIMALGAALQGLRTELTERIAALEAALAGAVPPAPMLSPAVSLDYVNDLVEQAQAPLLRRIRALEARLIVAGKD